MSAVATKPLRVLSMGGGVQTTCLFWMGITGDFERSDAVIFANTGDERMATKRHLVTLRRAAKEHGIPWHTVSKGNIVADQLAAARTGVETRFASQPLYVLNNEGETARLKRQCTSEYKTDLILKKCRELIGCPTGTPPAGAVEMWVGITLDEMARARTSDRQYVIRRDPFLEMRMTRWDCARWLKVHGYTVPPRSSCVTCPNHRNDYWRDLRAQSPHEWQRAVEFDRAIRHLPRVDSPVYLHRSLIPLDQVALNTPEDAGQMAMFGDESCDEGVCDV